ncbi:MAG TPA: tetratricopeptide repeat protein [Rhodanobacteraceae bacterium]|nr:tetratricopeptide repeat protein [Rhodanobacteraceae bacterium]
MQKPSTTTDLARKGGPLAAALAALALLAGCAQAPLKNSAGPAAAATATVPMATAGDTATAQVMAAELALRQGDAAAAARDYAHAAATSTDWTVAHRAALLAIGQDDIAGAERALARMRALSAPAIDVAGVQARLALEQGHSDAARRALQRVLSGGGRDAWSAFAQVLADARDAAAAGQLLQALATPQSLPADDPNTWLAVSQLGEKLGRHAYARTIANAAAERFASGKACAWAAHLALAVGDTAGAMAWFEKGLQSVPNDIGFRLAYAGALARLGHYGHAARMLADGPQTVDTYRARAAFAARADDDAALARIRDELADAPPALRRQATFLRAQLADSLGKPEEALKLYAEVPLDDKDGFDAGLRRAVLLDKSGRSEQAHGLVRQLQAASTDDDDHYRSAVQLEAAMYRRNGKPAKVIATFDRGLEHLPGDTDLLYGRALGEADNGRAEEAIADLRKVLQLDPDNMPATNALGYTLADRNKNLDEARTLLERALAAQPDEPAVIDSWGWLQFRLGHLEKAEKALRRAWDKLKDPDIGTHLGEVLWAQGQRAEAKQVFAAVRKIAPESATLKAALERLQR